MLIPRLNIHNRQKQTALGIVSNPLIFDRLGEPDTVNTQPLEKIVYFSVTKGFDGFDSLLLLESNS